VFGFGLGTWDSFLVPYSSGLAHGGGWHDEGARDWRTVRQLRLMALTGQADPYQAHWLLGQLGVRYVMVYEGDSRENPERFRLAFDSNPRLFQKSAEWGKASVYKVAAR
jgi:hypothetical protein